MKLSNLLGVLIIVFALHSCTGKDPVKNTKKIAALNRALVEDQSSVGIAFGIEVDTITPLNKVFGFANYESKESLNPNSKFRIASITKPFTATAILQLIESNQLAFDDKLTMFFPDFPNGDHITIYHLLSHTSGIPNWWNGEMPKIEPENFPMCPKPHQYLQQMKKTELFEPGTFFSYSNTGYVLLGEIIEIISKIKYEVYLEQNIFLPAGMTNTEMEYIESPKENWVKGYVKGNSKKDDTKEVFSKPDGYHMPFSAGGLRSTTEDLLLFLNALESGKLISKNMFAKMTSYSTLKNGAPVHESLYAHNGEAMSFPSNLKKFGYGLGFQIIENFGQKVVSHGGDIAGFNSVLMYIPHNNVKLAILANTENGILSKLKKIEKLAISIEPY